MSKSEWGIEGPAEEYWFNTRTREVEVGKQSLAMYRLGPFASRAEAEHAEETVAERARAWNEEDEDNA
ncbi:methionine aminopeptidase [Leucobacter denitrificans]|uniref:Methionine aminopeptidase n=1 Tax=Leucobacter denitrificans TaxID=683042 RepID=A0A7G9S5M3_9MICO|nr:methionine aminopeptidase [Leucobacter denitrificans]QNN63148.1 methionine aminopeptidase [Leucobacter denitrificans]